MNLRPYFRLNCLIASSLVITCLQAAPAQAEPSTPVQKTSRLVEHLAAGKKQTLVTFGTSLTAVGAWVDQLATVLEQTFPGQCTVINGAQGGANSDWGVKSLDEKVLQHKPDTVLIEFAVNDAVSKRKTDVDHARNNLTQIIDRILAQNPQCEIILQVMNIPVAHTRTGRPNLDAFNQMYRDVAKERGFQLIDHWPNWDKLLNEDPIRFLAYTPDTIHPVRDGALNVITPHLVKELGLATVGHPEKSTDTPCWNYLLHIARQDHKSPDTTRADYDAYWEKLFNMSDLDKDGSVNADEMQTDSLLKALDRDQNGTVSLDEWLIAQEPQFKAFDKDNNGIIDKQEKNQLVVTATAAAGQTIDLIASDGFQLNQHWVIDGGILSSSPTPGGILWSKQSYTNFKVSLEYQTTEKCNSGLFFRTDPQNPVQGGFEIQIASPGLYSGKHNVGSLYDAHEPSKAAGKPNGEWNHLTLTCQDSKITATLNGHDIQNLDINDWTTPNLNPDGSTNKFTTAIKDLPHHGHLGLQYHGQPIFFRNIRIQQINDPNPSDPQK